MITEWPIKKEKEEVPKLKCYKIHIFFSYRDNEVFKKFSRDLQYVFIEAFNLYECGLIWNDYFSGTDLYAEHPNDRDSSFSGQIFEKEEYDNIRTATAPDRYCDWDKKEGWIEKPRWKDTPIIPLEEYLEKDYILYIKNLKEVNFDVK